MRKSTKRTIGYFMIGVPVVYFIYRAIRVNSLYNQIAGAIETGQGGIRLLDNTYFNPNFHNDPGTECYYKTDDGLVKDWADTLDSDFKSGWGNDDEEGIYGVFRAMPDGVAVSQTAHKFQYFYGEDLFSKVEERLTVEEVSKVAEIVNDLPPYRFKDCS